MMRSRLRLGSAARLVALCAALTLLPLALLAYLSVRLASDAVEDNARAQVRSNAALAVSIFQSGMSAFTGTLTSAAARPELRTAATASKPDGDRLRRLLLELKSEQPTIERAFLTTPEGRLLAIVPDSRLPQGTNLRGSDWYRGITKSGQPYVSSAYRSLASGNKNVVAVAVPFRRAHAKRARVSGGILIATFDLNATQRFVDYFSTKLGIELDVTDQRGVLLARPGQRQVELVSIKDEPGVAAALRGESGFHEQSSESGVSLAAHAPIPGIGWTVTASVPKRTAFAGVDRLRSSVLVIAGILALLLLGGLAVLARSLRQRARAEAAAERARAEAELANRAKSEFLSRMSHELRTPLNAVLGFGQLLSMGELDDKEKESVDQILKGGQHLLGLINEILDIARIESGKLTLSIEPVEVSETVREALNLVQPLAAERQIEITVDRGANGAYVVADRQRLSQVLLNLLSNAIKYNRPGGSVRIRVEDGVDGTTRIKVTDSGDGIPPESLGRLFTPFERLGADEKQIDGTGLGLVLSKGLVEAMGGRLEVESQVGSGSTFRIQLQTTTSPVAAAEEEHHLPAGDIPPVGDRRYTILYIEDNLSNLKLVERILGDRPDVHLIAAMQGGLGVELAREHRPDLVLLDLHLPDIQGDEVLARLQADPAFNGTPVVVLSADATKGRIERLLDAGACAYLSKPIDVKQFLDVVNEYAPPSVLV